MVKDIVPGHRAYNQTISFSWNIFFKLSSFYYSCRLRLQDLLPFFFANWPFKKGSSSSTVVTWLAAFAVPLFMKVFCFLSDPSILKLVSSSFLRQRPLCRPCLMVFIHDTAFLSSERFSSFPSYNWSLPLLKFFLSSLYIRSQDFPADCSGEELSSHFIFANFGSSVL